jgi:hypothetical protein
LYYIVGVIGKFLRVKDRDGDGGIGEDLVFENAVFVGTKGDVVGGDRGELLGMLDEWKVGWKWEWEWEWEICDF